ncbi:unnamed protein product [Adineta ricciae]|uniref:Uncharacterized protein n=1 Tax=Adineta ricciae TaxID=249248 RepID=A0A815GPJ4_ADIRI|nr:unnamed protein product [Adineta ricciae]CAF1651711.1 unnamed protein product [Adineta ricciae]
MKFKTDKVYLHHYERFYEKYLSQYRDTSVRLLEIGLGCDMIQAIGASARTWREYLGGQAEIHILEIDMKCGEKWFSTIGKQINVTLHYGDQGNVMFLETFKSKMNKFDIIIDDGGHTMNQQRTSLITLSPLVRPGGLYIIEDLETSYRRFYGGQYLNSSTTIGMLKSFIDDVQSEVPVKTVPVSSRIFSFEIGDGICILTIK